MKAIDAVDGSRRKTLAEQSGSNSTSRAGKSESFRDEKGLALKLPSLPSGAPPPAENRALQTEAEEDLKQLESAIQNEKETAAK
mmetsp:Transcript_15909/g.34427  ORF Transcript_15909/g.34427 Transcript_15909/m.34427 type:complete len:84 (+) Transcript_15909:215-466(+)